jgi:pyruvate formate lyase activating enzyme
MSPVLHEAWFADRQPDGRVRCTLCPHDCRIADGSRGACAVRYNEGGVLYTIVYDRIVASTLEPIEKKPFFHVMPGSLAYSVATVGCNLQCTFCQNWEIAQWPRDELPRRLAGEHGEAPVPLAALAYVIPGRQQSPEAIVNAAIDAGASSIAYTFTEPTIYFELAYETAVKARTRGLKNLFVTNGFIGEPALRKIAAVLDAANVDLKFFREESYRRITRAGLQPILDAIRLYHALGVWVEVTTLVIPGVNDSDDELRQIAEFIRSVGPEVPWHVSQFYPTYKMVDRPATPVATLRRAREIGVGAGLQYVYEGNIPGQGSENTTCPGCRTVLVERDGFTIRQNRVQGGRCPACGTHISGIEMDGPHQELKGGPATAG